MLPPSVIEKLLAVVRSKVWLVVTEPKAETVPKELATVVLPPRVRLLVSLAEVTVESAGVPVFRGCPMRMAKKLKPLAGAVVKVMVLVLTV